MKIKVFDYITELDCFVVREEFRELMDRLGIAEWTPVVWICRLFALDNDFGEHIFDNWDERERIAEKARELRIDEHELLIVVPERFKDHGPYCVSCDREAKQAICVKCKQELRVSPDGPCHSDRQRKRFWTDVLQSLTLDLETIFEEARHTWDTPDEMKVPGEPTKREVEEEIKRIRDEYSEKT